MKKFIMMIALVAMGFVVTSAFSDDSTDAQGIGLGHICSPPFC